jgi:hypothetical protein
MGDRNRKIMWRRCIKRTPNPRIEKHMSWENVEQTTNTFIHIYSWKLKTLLMIYKKQLQRLPNIYKYNS